MLYSLRLLRGTSPKVAHRHPYCALIGFGLVVANREASHLAHTPRVPPAATPPVTNCFELHLGIPDSSGSVAVAYAALSNLRRQVAAGVPSWTYSDVRSVFVKNPGCFDPHNVPGTLRSLLSRELPVWEYLSGLDALIDHEVLPSAQSVMDQLAAAQMADARLEIEYPFGCFEAEHDSRGRLVRRAMLGDPITVEPERLRLRGASLVPNTPTWEIHFVVERRASRGVPELTIEQVPVIIEAHGVDIEQTIEYRSQSMQDRGLQDYKFISTSYYGSAGEVEAEARRLFSGTSLCQDFAARGYAVKLILEHIVACFQPVGGGTAAEKRPISVAGEHASAW